MKTIAAILVAGTLTGRLAVETKAAEKAPCQIYIWQFSKLKWTELARHGQKFVELGAYGKDFKGEIQGKMLASHLWVQREGAKP